MSMNTIDAYKKVFVLLLNNRQYMYYVYFILDNRGDIIMKKVFVSSDIEGVADISAWNEADKSHNDYEIFKDIMIEEVSSICSTLEEYCQEIVVRDAHDSARNIIHHKLPGNTKLIRGFNGNPDCMMFGLDESFDFSILHGYHSPAGTNFNPLSHTLSSDKIQEIRINGKVVGEVTISMYTSMMYNVPVCYIVGDKGAVEEAKRLNNNIIGTITKDGLGSCVKSLNPKLVNELIKEDLKKAMDKFNENKECFMFSLPERFDVDVRYVDHQDAYRNSFYPGVKLKEYNCINMVSKDFIDVLKMFVFCI